MQKKKSNKTNYKLHTYSRNEKVLGLVDEIILESAHHFSKT